MGWKRSKIYIAVCLLLFVLFMSQATLQAQADEEYTETEAVDYEYQNPQYEYATEDLDGLEINENKVKEKAGKLDYSEVAPKPKKEDKKKRESSGQMKRRTRSGGSFWLGDAGRITAYTLAFVILVVILVLLIGSLKRKDVAETESVATRTGRNIDRQELDRLDIDGELGDAIERGDFRMAIRLLYLKNLKLLMNKGLVKPSAEKTNMDYVREITETQIRNELKNTTGIFEWVWYGNWLPDKMKFAEYRKLFDNFYDQMRLR